MKRLYPVLCGTWSTLTPKHANLLIGAFFFAMRSCEYSKVTLASQTTHTKHKVIPHSNPNLGQRSTYISIQFRDQKKRAQNGQTKHSTYQRPDPMPNPSLGKHYRPASKRTHATIHHVKLRQPIQQPKEANATVHIPTGHNCDITKLNPNKPHTISLPSQQSRQPFAPIRSSNSTTVVRQQHSDHHAMI
jgi:hypothetical protein